MNLNHESVWANCLSFIEDNVSAQAFKTWFIPIKAVKLEDAVLTIQVPSQFFYEWLEEHYVDLLRKAIGKELGKERGGPQSNPLVLLALSGSLCSN